MSGQRQPGRERGHIWLIGQGAGAIRDPLGALLSERGEGAGVAASRLGGHLHRGDGRIGQELGCLVPAGRGAFDGVSGEDRSVAGKRCSSHR